MFVPCETGGLQVVVGPDEYLWAQMSMTASPVIDAAVGLGDIGRPDDLSVAR